MYGCYTLAENAFYWLETYQALPVRKDIVLDLKKDMFYLKCEPCFPVITKAAPSIVRLVRHSNLGDFQITCDKKAQCKDSQFYKAIGWKYPSLQDNIPSVAYG